jgi:hypothetical protein
MPVTLLPERFINYRLQAKPDSPKMDKIPCDGQGNPINPHDPSQWMTYAAAAARGPVGFVLNGDGWWCCDLDNCRDATTGQYTDMAVAIYQSFPGALGEVSVSGTGLHIFGRCDPSRLVDRRNKWDGDKEWYHTGRFIALSPHGLQPIGSEWIDRDWTDQLLKLVPRRADADGVLPEGVDPAYTGPADDAALIAMMLRSTSTAARFGSGATVADLWNADAAKLALAYPAYDGGGGFDHSSADAALMSHLAFWTGKDMPRMDRMFRASGLMRDKYRNRDDYRRDTIHGAARMCKRVYDVPQRTMPVPVVNEVAGSAQREIFLTVPEMQEHFKGCVYIRDLHRVFVPDGALLKPEQFNASYGGHHFQMLPDGTKPTKKAFEALTESMAFKFPQGRRPVFRPDLPSGTILPDEGVNIYVKPDVRVVRGDVVPFMDFLTRLLPVKRDRDILLAYMAACVQYPGVKFQWAPVLQGTEGNGKSLVASVVAYALGPDFVHEPRASQLAEKYNGYLEAKLLIVVEEVHMGGRREMLDELKPYITNRRIELRGMAQEKRMIDNVANWFFCTNHRDAVLKSKNDRRYAVFFTGQQSADDITRDGMAGGFFPALYQWLRVDGYAHMADWLMSYDIPDELNPATMCHRAPETSSTSEAVAASTGVVEAEIMEAIESDTVGFRGGWVSSHMLDRLLRDRGFKLSRPKIGSILTEMGFTQWGRASRPIMREDSKRPVLWCRAGAAEDYAAAQGPGYI